MYKISSKFPIVNSVPGILFDNVAGMTITGIGHWPTESSLKANFLSVVAIESFYFMAG